VKYKVGDKIVVSKGFVRAFPYTTRGVRNCQVIDIDPYDKTYKVKFDLKDFSPTLWVCQESIVGYQKANWFQKLFSR
jgi:hypothetical protein